jgi:O-methyltransferase
VTASAREIGASGPGAGVEELRHAYVELLKLALCDLIGPSTTSLEGRQNGRVVSRELTGDERRLRAEGRDWPRHALTMSGLARLDDLQSCVESIVREGLEGDVIEAGSWRGGGSILMRLVLDSLGDAKRTVWVADSFQGFPAPDAEARAGQSVAYPATLEPYLSAFDFLAAPFEEVKAGFARLGAATRVEFVPGFFEDTLPTLAGRRWSLVRLDADTYDATWLALQCLYPGLAGGGYLIVDDYGALDECRAAVDRFREEHGIVEPLETVDWTAVRWRRQDEAPIEATPATAPRRSPAPRARPGAEHGIATERELELEAQLEAARERLAGLSAEVERLRAVERELAEMAGSTSWRMTRPLRELRRYTRERQR